MGRNDLHVGDRESPGCIFITTAEVNAHLYVFPGFQFYVRYCGARKKLLGETVLMEAAETPPGTVFVGHGYVQHTSSEWHSEYCTCHPSYPNTESCDLPDAVAIAHESRIALGPQKHSLPVERGLRQQLEDWHE